MKRIFDSSRRGRRISLILTLTVMLSLTMFFSSCSGDKADLSELLATVPADASAVVAVNVKSLVEKSGCKIEGSKIVPGKEVKAVLDGKSEADNNQNVRTLRQILNGDAGIEPTVALLFLEGNDLYFTGMLSEPDKFIQFSEKEFGGKFTEKNGVKTLSNVALKGSQFWIRTSHNNDIESDQIVRFTALSDKLSFLSNPYSEKMVEIGHDIEGWGNLSSLYNASGMSFQQTAMAGMGLAILFSDPQDIAFHASFEDGRLVAGLAVLDSKGRPAKFNLPTDRIDIGMVKDFTDSADVLYAIAISPKLIDQLQKDLGNKNIPGFSQLMPALTALDGTSVFGRGTDSFKGEISTKGEGTAALSDFLSDALGVNVNKDGKELRFENGTVAGSIKCADMAPRFRGAMAACAMSYDKAKGGDFYGLQYKDMVALLLPADGSVSFEVTVNSDTPKENFILSYIKSAK